jgi:signal transduction histidine kinase/DNA-binding response OmpR family regulator
MAILEDSSGKIWLGTHDYGINILDDKSKRFYNLNSTNTPALKSNHIQCLMEDSRGVIWIGTYEGGITVFNPVKNSFNTFTHDELDSSSLCNDIVNYFYEDSKKRVWIATHGGISQFLPDKRKFRNITTGNASISFTNKITEDSQGNLWISSFEGLVKYHPDRNVSKLFRYRGDRDSLSDNYVYTVHCDKKDRIWIGTLSGLNLYDSQTGSFKLYNKSNGLQSNSVLTLVDDDEGNLWLGTTLGLSRFNPEREVFTNFNQRDGIVHNIFLYNSFFKSKSSTLYFGTSNGAVFFDPKDVNSIPAFSPNKIYITLFSILNVSVIHGEESVIQQPVNAVGRIVLKYTQSYISFDLTTFNFVNPYSDHYSYFLEGHDFGWIDLNSEHRITYTRIPPGKYILHIKVSNNFSQAESMKKMEIIVRPPVWRSGIAYLLYLSILIITGYLFYSYFRSKTIYKHNLLLERLESEKRNEINQSKIRFFINVAHEFKTPLTLILSPLERLLKLDEQLDKSYRKQLLGTIYKNAQMLNKLISQIIDLRKLETGKVTLEAQYLEIVSLLRDISGHFNDYASNHSIRFELEPNPGSIFLWIDPEKVEKIYLNLLSNAFNHTPDGGLIRVTIGLTHEIPGGNTESPEQPDHVIIRVSDTGPGIKPDYRERIFERFFRIDDNSLVNPSGSGIGLSIVKEYVELHHGKVYVDSKTGEGSTFTVLIPLGDSHGKPEERADNKYFTLSQDYSAFKIIPVDRTTKSTVHDRRNVRILVVEDNYELRQYMLESLIRDFDVYEADDGADGLRMAQELLPEIVISDVMMPKMNGFELCRAIKNDIRTSHIPFILLSVLDANAEKIYGFEEGADDYLNKPFSMDILVARINNLIESRNKLKQQYLSGNGLSLSSLVNTKTDRNFVEKAYDILSKNLSKFDFTAEYFAREIGMSRSNLHLKMKALTGFSTTEFIRDVRLKESSRILSTGKYNISEVAYLVGFNSVSYFNLCFKKKYSKTPSQYLDEIHVKIVPDIQRRL